MNCLTQLSGELRAAVEQGDFAAAEKLLARQRETLLPAPRSEDLIAVAAELSQLRLLALARRANDQATLAALRKPFGYPVAEPPPRQSWQFEG